MITVDEIIEDFSWLDQWEERLRYVVELGRELPSMPEEDKVDANRMIGCQSRVWIKSALIPSEPPTLKFSGASDAQIVQGLIAIVFSIVNGKTPQYITDFDIKEVFAELGLSSHLTPSRANGLNQLVETVKETAHHACELSS